MRRWLRIFISVVAVIMLVSTGISAAESINEIQDDAASHVSKQMSAAEKASPKSIKITGSKYVAKGKKITLKATVLPVAANQNVKWKSSNKKIATVSSKGVVKGISAGKVTITAISKKTNVKAAYRITVTKSATSRIRFIGYEDTIDLYETNTLQLKAKASPSGAAQSFNWSSNNKSVATVNSNGVVTGKKPGIALITAKAQDGSNKKASIFILVGNSMAPPEKLNYGNAEYYLGGNRGLDYFIALTSVSSDNAYEVDKAVKISFDIKGGKPPFTVYLHTFEGNQIEAYYTPLTEYVESTGYTLPSIKFSTNERHVDWSFTIPKAGGPITVYPSVIDKYGFGVDMVNEPFLVQYAGKLPWKYQYYDFVINGRFWAYDYDSIYIDSKNTAIFDMDADGIPELLIHNNDDSMAGSTYLTFTFRNDEVVFAGETGFRDCVLTCSTDTEYPGIFCTDGNMGC